MVLDCSELCLTIVAISVRMVCISTALLDSSVHSRKEEEEEEEKEIEK